MNDTELVAAILKVYKWKQAELADRLVCEQAFISMVLNGKRTLKSAARRKAEKLLQEAESK